MSKKIPRMRIYQKGKQYFPQFKKFIFWRNFITRKRAMSDSWDEIVWFDSPYRSIQFLKEAVENRLNYKNEALIAEINKDDFKGILSRLNKETGISAIMQDESSTVL